MRIFNPTNSSGGVSGLDAALTFLYRLDLSGTQSLETQPSQGEIRFAGGTGPFDATHLLVSKQSIDLSNVGLLFLSLERGHLTLTSQTQPNNFATYSFSQVEDEFDGHVIFHVSLVTQFNTLSDDDVISFGIAVTGETGATGSVGPSVSGTGVVKVENGLFKTPASLVVNADIATNAAISLSKIAGLTPAAIGAFGTADVIGLTNGGTAATGAQAAISNLSIGMRMVEAQTTANVVGTMNTNVSPNTFTVTATGVFAADGYTPVLGDIIAFALQTTTTQNGFWEVTTVGAVGVQAVFTRPSWYTGVVKNTMYMTRFGSTQGGFVMAFFGPLGTTEITVGTTLITAVQINYREKPALISSNTFTGPQIFRSNQATANRNPFSFSLGSGLMTTPQAHAVEWFGDQMYLTTAAGVRTTNTTHVAIPATSTSTGLVGQVAVDNTNNWLYVCTAANIWKRAALTTF
jgi:hypothetical protein